MTQKLIIFAQQSEAIDTIFRLKAKADPTSTADIWTEGKIPNCYHFPGGLIVIANTGVFSAQIAVSKYIDQADEVWNIGLAGALKNDLPIGTLVEIAEVGKHTSLPDNLDQGSRECVDHTIPPFSLPYPGAKLVSSDFPIHDDKLRDKLALSWDLVDMEGYGVAYAAKGFGKPFRLWKIVSDFASPGGRELIRTNKPMLSCQIASFINKQLT